jgi:hypothetical protein
MLPSDSGNAAYNASKAAVKSVVEGLAHELYTSQAKVTAHLFVCVVFHLYLAAGSGWEDHGLMV